MRTQYHTISVLASHTITVSGSVDVKESDRIKFKDRNFEIMTIKDPEENGRDKLIITMETRPGQRKMEETKETKEAK
jgi:head-tail adaptor